VVAFDYDDVGRRIAETFSISGEAPITISSAWDVAGNRTSIADSFGASSAMTHDGAGRLQSLLSAAGTVVIGHDPSGRMGGILFPSDASAVYAYDPMGRLELISHKDGSAAVLAAYTMGYDPVGSINKITDAVPERIRDFGYDPLRRLVSETIRPSAMAEPTETNSYTYSPSGNRQVSPFSQTHEMEVPNRLVSDDEFSYEYDDNGNLVSKTSHATSEQTVYHWDSRNQLTGIDLPGGAHAGYRYDALGRRIEKSVDGQTTRYVYDAEDIVLETDETGTLLRRYRHGDGIDQPLVLENAATGDSYFYHADHLGSVRLVTDEAGTVVSEYEYDPYGQRTVVAEGVEQPYAFTGREFDGESGLYYYRARYYDARQGRFLSEDPIGFGGGDANLYQYVDSSPINWRDPSGEQLARAIPGGIRLVLSAIAQSKIFQALGTLEASRLASKAEDGDKSEEASKPTDEAPPTPQSPELTPEELSGKCESDLEQLAKDKGLVQDPLFPNKWRDPVTGKQRLRIEPGHDGFDKASARNPHVHGYDPKGGRLLDPTTGDHHFPTLPGGIK